MIGEGRLRPDIHGLETTPRFRVIPMHYAVYLIIANTDIL